MNRRGCVVGFFVCSAVLLVAASGGGKSNTFLSCVTGSALP